MRTLKKNKQAMWYSLPGAEYEEYVLNDDGEKVVDYVDEEGNIEYLKTGNTVRGYQLPIEFRASISSSLSELRMKSWGVDRSSIYIEICVDKDYLKDWVENTIVWKKSEIKYEDEAKTIVKSNSSDYTVVGIMDEGLTEDWYLLRRNNTDTEE